MDSKPSLQIRDSTFTSLREALIVAGVLSCYNECCVGMPRRAHKYSTLEVDFGK